MRALEKEFALFFAEGLSKSFGGLQAVQDFSLKLQSGEIVGLIGPNGAGKTTVFNLITGLDTADSGRVYFRREYVTGLAAYRIARLGIARTFQNIRLLGELSVLENIMVAYHAHVRYGWLAAALRLPRYRRAEREIMKRAMEFLELFGLHTLAHEPAASLPYGLRRKLEIARALSTEATLLLLDEPAAGLNAQETGELMELIRYLRDRFHVTILLIEHDMRLVMNLCERVVVLNFGQVIASGTPAAVKEDAGVVEAYLGQQRDPA